jgi:hypothetical protein
VDYETNGTVLESDELKDAAHHITYELVMMDETLNWCAEHLQISNTADGEVSADAKRKSNAYLESCVVHCRNLVGFFAGKRSRGAVLARDFISDWTPDKTEIRRLQSAMEAHDKRVFHVTAYRAGVDEGVHERPLFEIRNEIHSMWLGWFKHLSDEQREWFNSAANQV